MFKFIKLFLLLLTVFISTSGLSIAVDRPDSIYLITENSIGIAQIGKPLKEFKREAAQLNYKIKEAKDIYTVYDEHEMPILVFTVFNSYSKTKPLRTIKTTSSQFKLETGQKLVGTPVSRLTEEYPEVSIIRINSNVETPEHINFKGWPFSDSITKGKYLIKYETVLNKIRDEYGNVSPVGNYPTEFSLFTNDYLPEAKIESFQIEGIEPKFKFEGQKF
jgi:hypothetical protein